MKLVTRVSAFLLVVLFLALAGFSLTLHLMMRHFLNAEFDGRLQAAVQVLAASIEIEPEDVTWNPQEYTLDFDQPTLHDVRWVVADELGRVVDHSSHLTPESPLDVRLLEYGSSSMPRHYGTKDLDSWRIVQRYVAAPQPQSVNLRDELVDDLRESDEHSSLLITVALPHQELDTTLARLTALLATLPIAVWLLAATLGRAAVRRSLSPLTAMADQARSTVGADFRMRLPTDSARDELHDLAVTFNRLLDQLQQAYERQQNFTGDAAHQLRTPLTVLQGELDLALRRPRTAEQYRDCLDKLAGAVQEMRQLVESLLFLARSDGDALPPAGEPVELESWLPQYLERWRQHPRWDDLSWHIDGSSCVRVSAALLTQLLDNLLQNAFNYSPAGSAVSLEVDAEDETVTLAVRDRGMGISPADQNAVFEPFFRTARARQSGVAGTGLGLAVARRIARALGGTLDCRSSAESGTVFELRLPRLVASDVGVQIT